MKPIYLVKTESVLMPSSTSDNPLYFEIKRRKMKTLARSGMLPSGLLSKLSAKGENADIDPEDQGDLMKMSLEIESFMLRSVVYPEIIREGEPQEGQVLLEDLEEADHEFLLAHVLGSVESDQFETFRLRAAGIDHRSDVQEIQLAPIDCDGAAG